MKNKILLIAAFLFCIYMVFDPPFYFQYIARYLPSGLSQFILFLIIHKQAKKFIKANLTVFLLCFCFIGMNYGQPYIDGNKRYSFAQTVVGLDFEYTPNLGKSAYLNESGGLSNYNFGEKFSPRFTISGLHFWGHAEFYVTIPLANIKMDDNGEINSSYSNSTETGLRIYPWRIEHHKLRPFVGLSMNPTHFRQSIGSKQGTFKMKTRTPLQAGLTFNHKGSLLEFGFSYYPRNKYHYYIDRNIQTTVETPQYAFHLGYKFYFDTTTPLTKALESGYLARKTKALEDEGLLNGLSLGLGFSSVFFLKESEYNNDLRPYLDHHKSGNSFLEWGLGYYFFKKDIQLNLAYRKMKTSLSAYDLKQSISRRSISLEAFKFLGDYHGFSPFIGPVLSLEILKAKEHDFETQTLAIKTNKVSPGIVFGWDIRPHRLQSIVLRTNLRYFPNLYLEAENGKKLSLDNLEFNFIQIVYYPGISKRIKNFKL